MLRLGFLIAAVCGAWAVARADDGLRIFPHDARVSGNPNDVSISGVSAGAAMAVQFAVAHSNSIVGVGAIAGPPWGGADGRVSTALNCMCGLDPHALEPKIDLARQMAAGGKIDGLNDSGKPQMLRRAYVFQSPADPTVVNESGNANIAFLRAFIGKDPTVDRGNEIDGSNQAGHGIITPEGNEPCQSDSSEITYIRSCGAEDNAGKMFHALYDPPGSAFDPSKRVNHIPKGDVWQFDQQHLIDDVKAGRNDVAPDLDPAAMMALPLPQQPTYRRQNFDMAEKGYVYVPPSCRNAGSACRVHIALHGCKQNPYEFATKAGYNNWAEWYKVIIVYPAQQPYARLPEKCGLPVGSSIDNTIWAKVNMNACWDWWGYLDIADQRNRYLTAAAPQMMIIERIVNEVTNRK